MTGCLRASCCCPIFFRWRQKLVCFFCSSPAQGQCQYSCGRFVCASHSQMMHGRLACAECAERLTPKPEAVSKAYQAVLATVGHYRYQCAKCGKTVVALNQSQLWEKLSSLHQQFRSTDIGEAISMFSKGAVAGGGGCPNGHLVCKDHQPISQGGNEYYDSYKCRVCGNHGGFSKSTFFRPRLLPDSTSVCFHQLGL